MIEKFKKEKIKIYALENNVKNKRIYDYCKVKYPSPLVIVLGHEVKGILPKIIKLSDKIIKIPMNGVKESLNVEVAYAVLVYEILKQNQN